MYKDKTFRIDELVDKASHEMDDWEEQKRKKEEAIAARLRILKSLPRELVVTGIHMYPLFGTEASVNIQLDGGPDEVVQRMLGLLADLPPEPAERIVSSCVWVQPEGHREERNKHDYESPKTIILPICPVWARASHVANGNNTYLEFNWFVKMPVMHEDSENDTYADEDPICLRIDAKVLNVHEWVRYSCRFHHEKHSSVASVTDDTMMHRFVEPVVKIVGGGGQQASGRTIYWEHGTEPASVLRRSDNWSESRRQGY